MATAIIGNLTISGSGAVTMSLPDLPAANSNYVSLLTYNTQSGQVGYINQSTLFPVQNGIAQTIAFWQNTTTIEPFTPFTATIGGPLGLVLNGNLRLGKDTFIPTNVTGAFAAGFETTASGNYSHAEGYRTKALGDAAHSLGSGSIALGLYSLATGVATIASGSGQVVVGRYNAHNNVSSSFVVGGGSSDTNRKDIFSVDLGSNSSGSIMIPTNASSTQAGGHPSNPRTGSIYFNPTLNLLWAYNGNTWKSASLA